MVREQRISELREARVGNSGDSGRGGVGGGGGGGGGSGGSTASSGATDGCAGGSWNTNSAACGMAQRSIPCVRPPTLQIMVQQQQQQQQQNLTQDYLQQDSPPTTPKKRPRECSSQDSLYVRNPCPCNTPLSCHCCDRCYPDSSPGCGGCDLQAGALDAMVLEWLHDNNVEM